MSPIIWAKLEMVLDWTAESSRPRSSNTLAASAGIWCKSPVLGQVIAWTISSSEGTASDGKASALSTASQSVRLGETIISPDAPLAGPRIEVVTGMVDSCSDSHSELMCS